MARLEVASGKAVGQAIGLYETINDWFKSFGIVTGGLAASLADWVFGAVTMSVLLSKYSGWENGWAKWAVGGIFSLALWGIQIILWQLVLTGKIGRLSNNKTYIFWMYVLVFLVIICMKFGDDISDLFGVYWLVRDNPMKDVFTHNLYLTLLSTILFLAWVVCGFSEIFMALSINLLKSNDNQQTFKPQYQSFNQNQKGHNQQKQNQHKGSDRRKELEGQYHKPAPPSSNRSPYQEPTYHSVSMNPSENDGLARLAKEIMKEQRGKEFFGE